MPIKSYYGGHGERVMRDMIAKYGEKKGKEVFYATENKRRKKEVVSHVARKLRKK